MCVLLSEVEGLELEAAVVSKKEGGGWESGDLEQEQEDGECEDELDTEKGDGVAAEVDDVPYSAPYSDGDDALKYTEGDVCVA